MERHACLIPILLFFVVPNAYGFDGDEHHDMSQRSFEIAAKMTYTKQRGATDAAYPRDISQLLGMGNPAYGDIVEKVDYVLDPSIMFVQIGLKDSYPASSNRLNVNIFGPDAIGASSGSLARSSHNNDAHFQGQVMFSMYDWHRRALDLASACGLENQSTASDRCNLYAALVANAISDHYLEDFFAPGHIVTPRYNFPDLFALAMHDVNNYIGAVFCVDYTGNRGVHMGEVLDFIKNTPDHFGFKGATIEKLESKPDHIFLHGDGELADNELEELLITTVEVQSIREVLQCAQDGQSCRDPESSDFVSYAWIPTTYGSDPEVDAARPKSCSGHVNLSSPYPNVKPPVAEIEYGHYDIEQVNVFNYGAVLGLSASQETLFSDTTQYRADWDIETVPFGFPGAPDFMRKNGGSYAPLETLNWGPAIGYMHMYSSQYHASGPTGRIIFAWPQIDSQLSFYVRHLEYTQNTSRHEWSYGIRGDIGFSMITAYAAIGRDYGFLDNGQLRAGRMLQLGVTVSYPVSRIPGLEKLSHWASGPRYPDN